MEKTAVFGMIERGGEVRTETVKHIDHETLLPIIYQNVAEDTKIMTDEAVSLQSIKKELHTRKS